MTVCVFLGPTVPLAQARERLDGVYLPPVRHGDVYRAAVFWRPRAIGIIDGYFHQVPAVWHKEILWAMAAGIHVFGSASMGALRAAELAPFGMTGVGRIFEAYRDGVLHSDRDIPFEDDPFEDDDEVAVIHGPAETGYVSLSEALVNIRCTLDRARAEGIIDDAVRKDLVRIGKETFYQQRSYEHLLNRARDRCAPADQLEALRRWLPTGSVNQKQADAIAMLERMREIGTDPLLVCYSFQHTTMWEEAMASAEGGDEVDAPVLEELRRDPGRFEALRRQAILTLLGEDEPALSVGHAAPETSMNPDTLYRMMAEGVRMHAVEALANRLPEALIERHILRQFRRAVTKANSGAA